MPNLPDATPNSVLLPDGLAWLEADLKLELAQLMRLPIGGRPKTEAEQQDMIQAMIFEIAGAQLWIQVRDQERIKRAFRKMAVGLEFFPSVHWILTEISDTIPGMTRKEHKALTQAALPAPKEPVDLSAAGTMEFREAIRLLPEHKRFAFLMGWCKILSMTYPPEPANRGYLERRYEGLREYTRKALEYARTLPNADSSAKARERK